MDKHPCPDCGRPINVTSTRCSSCTTRAQWADPEQRAKKIAAIKASEPPRPRAQCQDCGQTVKTLGATRCAKCQTKRAQHAPRHPLAQSTKDKIAKATTVKHQDPVYKARWMISIRARSASDVWRSRQLAGSRSLAKSPTWIAHQAAAVRNAVHSTKWRDAMRDNPCWQRGEAHPAWKGGYRRKRQRDRCHKEYKVWLKDVYERDDYTCQKCGKRGGYLHAHHIKGWSEFPELRFDVSNGLTLCADCHSTLHGHHIPGRWRFREP